MSDRERILAEAEKRMIDFMEKAREVCETNVNLSSQYSALVSEYGCFISFIKNLPEEPTSSDLEEVAANYEEEMWKRGHPENTYTSSDIIKAVKYGANWQKQQIMRGAVL